MSEQALVELSHAWDRAMLTNDADLIGDFLAEEWLIIGADGNVSGKEEFLGHIRAETFTHDTMTSEGLEVRLYGDTAVILSRGVSGGQFRGRPFKEHERASSVFVQRDGRWRCVLTHVVPLRMPSAEPDCARRLRLALARAEPLLRAITAADAARPPAPGKWSPKEIIGHLIDSASNNHQRFVRGALGDDLVFPGYAQDEWVALQQYRATEWGELLSFWLHFNRHIVRVMSAVPEDVRLHIRERHNLGEIATHAPKNREQGTLDYFMLDYVDHLEMHLRQILGDRFS